MAAKWQFWMPLHIDRFFGSPAVQAMPPEAQMGYLSLLTRGQWQSDDGTISSDPLDLAEKSGLGDERWVVHGPRILRNFVPVNGTGRLRNLVNYEEWLEAKRVFDKNHPLTPEELSAKRSAAGRLGNEVRWGSIANRSHLRQNETQTDPKSSPTTVVPVVVNVPVSVEEKKDNDSCSELMLATWLFEELGIVGGFSEQHVAAEAIRLLAKEGGTTKNAADYILAAGKQAIAAGEVIDRFWFTGQKYRPQTLKKSAKRKEGPRCPECDAPLDVWGCCGAHGQVGEKRV
jgi:hypothetical protein